MLPWSIFAANGVNEREIFSGEASEGIVEALGQATDLAREHLAKAEAAIAALPTISAPPSPRSPCSRPSWRCCRAKPIPSPQPPTTPTGARSPGWPGGPSAIAEMRRCSRPNGEPVERIEVVPLYRPLPSATNSALSRPASCPS